MKHNEYNGMCNYETWLYYSWLLEFEDYWVIESVNNCKDIDSLIKIIKNDLENDNPTDGRNNIYASLLNNAISKINFEEIAHELYKKYKNND